MNDDDDKSSQRTTDESNKVRRASARPPLYSVGFTPPDTSNAIEAVIKEVQRSPLTVTPSGHGKSVTVTRLSL